jgi:hypothetical protein
MLSIGVRTRRRDATRVAQLMSKREPAANSRMRWCTSEDPGLRALPIWLYRLQCVPVCPVLLQLHWKPPTCLGSLVLENKTVQGLSIPFPGLLTLAHSASLACAGATLGFFNAITSFAPHIKLDK